MEGEAAAAQKRYRFRGKQAVGEHAVFGGVRLAAAIVAEVAQAGLGSGWLAREELPEEGAGGTKKQIYLVTLPHPRVVGDSGWRCTAQALKKVARNCQHGRIFAQLSAECLQEMGKALARTASCENERTRTATCNCERCLLYHLATLQVSVLRKRVVARALDRP